MKHTKEIVAEVKRLKAVDQFNIQLESLWGSVYYLPSDYKLAVIDVLTSLGVPVGPITNGTANAIASALE